MPKISKTHFINSLQNQSLNVGNALQDNKVGQALREGGVSQSKLIRADLNRDGFITGTNEAKRLFEAIDIADRNGSYQSLQTTDRQGNLTKSGKLYQVLSEHIKEKDLADQPTITRNEFVRSMDGKGVDVESALQDPSVMSALQEGGVGQSRLTRADANRDGVISGRRETDQLFTAIDVADRNGTTRSIKARDGAGNLTKAGTLYQVLSNHIKEVETPAPSTNFDVNGPWSGVETLTAQERASIDTSAGRITNYKNLISEASQEYGVAPEIIAAIMHRETKARNIRGDGGHGRGLMQIDDRYHGSWLRRNNEGMTPSSNVDYGVSLLKGNLRELKRSGLSGERLMKGALAAYNSGLGSVKKAIRNGYDLDRYTSGRDYGADVLRTAEYLRTTHPDLF